jgi:hypothetical protein
MNALQKSTQKKALKGKKPKFIYSKWENLKVFTDKLLAIEVMNAVKKRFFNPPLRLFKAPAKISPWILEGVYCLEMRSKLNEGQILGDSNLFYSRVRAFIDGFLACTEIILKTGKRDYGR